MNTAEHKRQAAELGLEWSAVLTIYREARQLEAEDVARRTAIRQTALAFMGYDHAGQWKLAHRAAVTTGDADQLRAFDVAAATTAANYPELGDNPAPVLYELLCADAPALTPADVAMAQAMERALELKVDADEQADNGAEWIRLVEGAHMADVTEQWLRQLVKAGKVRGRKAGRNWQVSRADVEFFARHPTMGRPRREPAPF